MTLDATLRMSLTELEATCDLYGHLFKETGVSVMSRLSMRMLDLVPESMVRPGTGTDG